MKKKIVAEEITDSAGNGSVPEVANTPSAKRPADRVGNGEPMKTPPAGDGAPGGLTSKVEIIQYVTQLLAGMDLNDATKLFDKIKTKPDGGPTTPAAATIKTYKEDMDAALEGTELSEDLKFKISTIFEAVVGAQVTAITEEIKEEYAGKLEEATAEIRKELETKVTDTLNYFGEKYISENKAPIVSGLKVEVATSFFNGIKNVFAEHNVSVPDDQVSAIEEMSREIAEIEDKLNKFVSENVTLTKEVLTLKAKNALEESIAGLTDVEKAKIRELSENVEFSSVEEFQKRVDVFIESFSTKTVKAPSGEEVVSDPITENTEKTSASKSHYEAFMKRSKSLNLR